VISFGKPRDASYYGVPHYWLEVAVKGRTLLMEEAVVDYLVPRVAKYLEGQPEGVGKDAKEIEAEVRKHLEEQEICQTCRHYEFAVAEILRELASRHADEFDDLMGEKFYAYDTETERLQKKREEEGK
jgi:hypothetical protein